MANVIVIPARLASTRLPNKLLLDDTGRPLICHTVDRALESKADAVIVASEDLEILDAVPDHHRVVKRETPSCSSGTERVAWVAETHLGDVDKVINLQGDEPELDSEHLDALFDAVADPVVDVATIASPASNLDYKSYSVVKVVVDHDGNAMYFSRCSIPYGTSGDVQRESVALKHIGVYAYRFEFLLALSSMEPTTLGCESLEQLQWLQSGFKVKVLQREVHAIGVDTRQEYDAFVRRWQQGNISQPQNPKNHQN